MSTAVDHDCPPLDLIRGRMKLAREIDFCPTPALHHSTESDQRAFYHQRSLHDALRATLGDLEAVLAELERVRAENDELTAGYAVPGEGDQS